MATAKQRLQQGLGALLAGARPVDLRLARRHLTVREFEAFQRMARAEQLHSLEVLRDILAQDEAAPSALAVAALLHDVGKSRCHLALWQKTASVLVKALLPRLAVRLGRGEGLHFWRAPFTLHEHHPQWSGDILRACGSDGAAIWLAEHHQENAEKHQAHRHYGLLKRLQAADEAN